MSRPGEERHDRAYARREAESLREEGRREERARIVADLRFIESSDKCGNIPTVRAMVAKRFADDIEVGRPLRGTE